VARDECVCLYTAQGTTSSRRLNLTAELPVA